MIESGICSECSELKARELGQQVVEEQLIGEFGELHHDPNWYGDRINRNAPEGYALRFAKLYSQGTKAAEDKYKKPIITLGYQDPYPYNICEDCLKGFLKEFG